MNTQKTLAHKEGVGNLVRPLYAAGLLLEDTDLTTAVDYTRNALQLAMRSLFGCGVVCGLGIAGKFICERRQVQITVSAGVALDCEGNLIHVPKDVTVIYDPKCDPMKSELWVEVCYKTCESKPGATACSEEDSLTTTNRRSRDAYAIRVWGSRPKCACACPSDDPGGTNPDPTDCCGSLTVTTTVESSCCGQEKTATTTTTAGAASPNNPAPGGPPPASPVDPRQEALSRLCACYVDHNNGKCGCDCGGNCVLLGKLRIPDSTNTEDWGVDTDLRRFVRPMLLGSKECYCAQCQGQQQGEYVDAYAYDVSRGDRQYLGSQLDNLQRARVQQFTLADRLVATRQTLTRITGDIATQKEEIQRLQKLLDGPQSTEQEKKDAELGLKQARARIAELEAHKDRTDKRIEAQQLDLDTGEKRLARLGIDRNIAAHHQELAYIDERLLQRPGGKDALLTKQRETTLEAIKGEMEKLTKLK